MVDPVVVFVILAGVSLVVIETYSRLSYYLNRRSWQDLLAKYWGEPQLHHGKHYRFRDIVRSRKTGQGKASTAVEQYFESLYFKFTFGFVYPILLVELVCFRLPLYLSRMAWSKCFNGFYSSHSEQDVVDCLLSCPPLYMMCKAVDKETVLSIYQSYNFITALGEENNEIASNDLMKMYLDDSKTTELENDQAWLFELPEELPGEAFSGDLQIRHATIIFLQRHRRILFASHLGIPLDLAATTANSTNLNLLFTLVSSSIITWAHVKTHMMAEISAEQIARGRLDALEPSARFVDSLHEGLINSPRSPIGGGHLHAASVSRDTIERRMLHRTPHYLDPRKNEFPAYTFLLQARRSLACRLKESGLSKVVTTEFLFQNMVVHSVDHYLTHAFLASRPHSLDGSESFRSYMQSFIVYAFWSKPKYNLLDDQRLPSIAKKSPSNGFYKKVYDDLKDIDPCFADILIVSCSY